MEWLARESCLNSSPTVTEGKEEHGGTTPGNKDDLVLGALKVLCACQGVGGW